MTEHNNGAERRLRRVTSRGGGRIRLARKRTPWTPRSPHRVSTPAGAPPGPVPPVSSRSAGQGLSPVSSRSAGEMPPVLPSANPIRPGVQPGPSAALGPRIAPERAGLSGAWWPELPGAASPLALGAVAAAGLVAAASLPLQRPGIGWLVTGLTAAAGVLAVALAGGRTPADAGDAGPAGTGTRVARVAWAVAALALLAVGAVRAAGWLFLLCLPAAAVAAALALVGGRTARQIAVSVVLPPIAAVRGLPWAMRGLDAIQRRRGGQPARLAVAMLVTLALLAVFGALFSNADAAFARLLSDRLPDLRAGTVFRWVFLFVLAGAGTLGAIYLVLSRPRPEKGTASPARGIGRLEWALPLGALTILFAAFVLVQLTVLFGGSRHVLRTAGLTYAEYARQGFWQLLVVTLLTLAVLAAAARWAPRDTPADRAWVRGLLGGLALLTLVIVASALYRMHVYEQAYGFTRLRVFVSAVELALGAVFAMVLAAVVRLRGGWLPQAVVATGVATLLGLAVLNPDQFIADRNVDRYQRTGRIDTQYLSRLSADAVPALDRLAGPERACALHDIQADLRDDRDGWRDWNLGRAQARAVLAARPSGQPARTGDLACWRFVTR